MDDNLLRLPECGQCGEGVFDYAPGVSSAVRDGQLFHPACLNEGHPVGVSAQYAREVYALLTSGDTKTRSTREHPLLNEEEAEEFLEDYLLGVPAKTFAAKLETRDIARFEHLSDPYPQREHPEVEMN
jgi:hypothetical protein